MCSPPPPQGRRTAHLVVITLGVLGYDVRMPRIVAATEESTTARSRNSRDRNDRNNKRDRNQDFERSRDCDRDRDRNRGSDRDRQYTLMLSQHRVDDVGLWMLATNLCVLAHTRFFIASFHIHTLSTFKTSSMLRGMPSSLFNSGYSFTTG